MSLNAGEILSSPLQRRAPPLGQRTRQNSDGSSIDQLIKSDTFKNALNIASNGTAAGLNFLTFLNGNFHFFDFIQEKLEAVTDFATRAAVVMQGIVLSIDTWKKKNLIPFLGFALEIPIALFSSGYDLWFNRGISQGLGQFQGVIDRREIIKDGKPVLEGGKPKYIGGDFSKKGWMASLKTTLKEIPKLASELIKNPLKIANSSHGIFLSSVGQIIGGTLGFLGLTTFGAAIRDIFGTLVDFAFITDKKSPKFVSAGLTWVLAAVVDLYKRIPFLGSNNWECLTNLSLTSDRAASLLYTIGNLDIKAEACTDE